MTLHRAACRCGALTADCSGEPVRISVCHCLDCQRRSGSAFSAQARWPAAAVVVSGDSMVYETTGEGGRWGRFNFCPRCGSTVTYQIEYFPDLMAIPLGAFADPNFPAPAFSVWERRKHDWVALTGEIEHHS